MPDTATDITANAAVDAVLRAGIETPAYVYDLTEVRANTDRLRAALPERTGLYYSLKANPHPAVLGALRAADVAAEVCSPGELEAALEAGWPADGILYTGPGKRDDDVAAALRAGVREFCVDSPTGLDQLERLADAAGARVRCLVRINDDQPVAGGALAMTGVASQFGADASWVRAQPASFGDRPHVAVIGLHFYMGSNVDGVDALLAQFARELDTAKTLTDILAPHITGVRVLDLGGGFAAPFARDGAPVDLAALRDGLAALLDERVPGWPGGVPRVVFESGRHLVATAGVLITRVLDVKRSHGKDIAVLESGINHLGGMSGLRRLPPLNPMLHGPSSGAPPVPTVVTGPLCTPLDTWSRAAELPPLAPGDVLVVPNVGAYGLYASLVAFLGHPAPVEVAVEDGAITHVSRIHLTRKD
ncbi:alanine racemase [Saccharothrix sp. ALI-22-I]|uniref:alanine racemase n=1 Tax=Saccharothrix sp. ALI-22-I TaxID=1933778 RepID=UPI001EE6F48C|nr:alanine racemase [Saccharothrix sp. ALI-22-I]